MSLRGRKKKGKIARNLWNNFPGRPLIPLRHCPYFADACPIECVLTAGLCCCCRMTGPGPGRPGRPCLWWGRWPPLALLAALAVLPLALAQCPWHRDVKELQSSCICAYNLGQELSVQCDMVDFPRLLAALDRYARDASLDLLYVNNSSVGTLADDAFRHLRLKSVQLSGCKIRAIGPHAFRHQEQTLKNLNLQARVAPTDSLFLKLKKKCRNNLAYLQKLFL